MGLFLVWGELFNFVAYISNRQEDQLGKNLQIWTSQHRIGFVIALAAGLLLAVILMQMYFRGKAGLIWATKAIADKKEHGFSLAFKNSRKYFMRLFVIWFVTSFLLILAASILAVPVAYLLAIKFMGRALILGTLALFIFIPLSFLVNFINNLAPMYVVLHDMKVSPAISLSFEMVKKLWVAMLIFSFFLGLLTLVSASILSVLWSMGVVFLGNIFYNTGGFHLTIGSVLSGIIALGAFLIFSSWIAVYQQIAWVLLFAELNRPIKLEEEELPVPEIV